MESKILKRDITIIIISAFIATLGATFGSFYAASIESKQWERNKQAELSEKILAIKYELLERAHKIISKQQIFYSLYQKAKLHGDSTKLLSGIVTNFDDLDRTAKSYESMVKTHRDLNELYSEYSVVMSLYAVYFGQNTKKHISELTKDKEWWEHPKLFKAVLKSMRDEHFTEIQSNPVIQPDR